MSCNLAIYCVHKPRSDYGYDDYNDDTSKFLVLLYMRYLYNFAKEYLTQCPIPVDHILRAFYDHVRIAVPYELSKLRGQCSMVFKKELEKI